MNPRIAASMPSGGAPPMPEPAVEASRVDDLRSFEMLDTPREEPFDGIVEVAAALFDVPVALLTFMDADRQWFKASVGAPFCSTPREHALCNHTIVAGSTVVVPDLTQDERFRQNVFVVSGPQARFYAGTPLMSHRKRAVGTLCVLDVRPREFAPERLRLLERLARQAVDALESHRTIRELRDGLTPSERAHGTKRAPRSWNAG